MVKAYAVNCNDAWLIPSDEPKEGHYVKYEDYEALEVKYQNLLQVISESMRKIEMEIAADD